MRSTGIAHARRSCSTYLKGSPSPLQVISMENKGIEEEIMRYKHLICSDQVSGALTKSTVGNLSVHAVPCLCSLCSLRWLAKKAVWN